MSQEFMDPEIFSDFIVEAKEHLETIEPNLLLLEKSPDSLELLNDIFRPMHSLKGASGFLGLNRINGLAHRAENILDELRKGSMRVTSEIMDVILSATDNLRAIIDNLETIGQEGEVNTLPTINRIDALLAGEQAGPGQVASEPAAASGPDEAAPMARLAVAGEAYALAAIGEEHLADFLEEGLEIIDNLNAALLVLEKEEQGAAPDPEIVNDIFRYFHNLKGNSGIIGYKELNVVTHEAETLLGRVRKGEISPDRPLIDLLLASVDAIEALVGQIDPESGKVLPLDPTPCVLRLQRFSAGQTEDSSIQAGPETGAAGGAVADTEPASPTQPASADPEVDPEDVRVFEEAVAQQFEHIHLALDGLAGDGTRQDFIDSLYRSLVTVQNSAAYMELEDIRIYAERTAGLVDQGRKADLDFSLMIGILSQECAIIHDMVAKATLKLKGTTDVPTVPAASEEKPAPTPEPAAVRPAPEAEKVSPEVAPSAPPVASAAKPAPKASRQAAQAAKAEDKGPQAASPQSEDKAAQKAKASSTIRVDHEKLDHLMNLIGELIINRNRYSLLAKSLEEGQLEVQEVAQLLTETTYAMARISDDLQDTIMKVRMVPVSTVFSRFPRLIRDLSRKSGKLVELALEGEETELDKSIVEVIGDPLVHLIRNSVDHGLEPEDERIAAGKPPVGNVWLRAYHKGNSVAIEVEDDGRGIDPEKMRQSAIRKGLITTDEARGLDDRAAIELIFAPGFSTAEKITDISGRGVGMDVVRSNIKDLKGTVAVVSEVGKGSRFILSLPLTLAIIDALMVEVAGQIYAIPLDAVSETTKVEARKLSEVNHRKALTLRGEVLGIIELAELLDLPRAEEKQDILQMVVIQDNDRRLGLVVDKLLERQDVVIKPLGTYLSGFTLRGISGATIMGDGSVVLILDPHEIYKMAVSK